ncbi:MAG: hypothetical protein B7C24_14565 [Bacteroidetes bacterium 4572_77]|nr:MAG: hypothetical protein B7C24_14565 [Bacteroidetes bacterium 4572_77]
MYQFIKSKVLPNVHYFLVFNCYGNGEQLAGLGGLKKNLSNIVNDDNLKASDKLKGYLLKRMEILNEAANYHETLKADFFEHFDFIDDLRSDLDQWEKMSIRKIILEGVDNGEFVIVGEIDVLLDVYIMVLKGLEIPFFLQNKYGKYAPHFESLMGIFTKGLSR